MLRFTPERQERAPVKYPSNHTRLHSPQRLNFGKTLFSTLSSSLVLSNCIIPHHLPLNPLSPLLCFLWLVFFSNSFLLQEMFFFSSLPLHQFVISAISSCRLLFFLNCNLNYSPLLLTFLQLFTRHGHSVSPHLYFLPSLSLCNKGLYQIVLEWFLCRRGSVVCPEKSFSQVCVTPTQLVCDTDSEVMASPKSLYFFIVLYAICLMTPACFVYYELACLPNCGTDYVRSHSWDADSLLVRWTPGLPSYSNHLSLVLYSCYLMKSLYNMILLPSNAHSNEDSSPCPLPCPDCITAADI